jgi:hypothetical protein
VEPPRKRKQQRGYNPVQNRKHSLVTLNSSMTCPSLLTNSSARRQNSMQPAGEVMHGQISISSYAQSAQTLNCAHSKPCERFYHLPLAQPQAFQVDHAVPLPYCIHTWHIVWLASQQWPFVSQRQWRITAGSIDAKALHAWWGASFQECCCCVHLAVAGGL